MISCRTWAVFSNASSKLGLARIVLRFENTLLGDQRQVAVFEGDRVEPAFPMAQHVREIELVDAGDVLADEFPQVTLPGDEADDRHRAFGLPGLDELGEFVPLGLDEVQICRMGRQPQDQFIEEQDQPIVAKRLGVGTDDRQPHVQIDVGFVLSLGNSLERREDVLDQIAHEPGAFVAGGRGFQGRFKPGGVPALCQFAPARVALAGLPLVQVLEELLVAEPQPMLLGILEDVVGQVDAGERSLRVMLHHVIDVSAQDGRLHVAGTDHVIRHEQELPALDPRVLGETLAELLDGS